MAMTAGGTVLLGQSRAGGPIDKEASLCSYNAESNYAPSQYLGRGSAMHPAAVVDYPL